MSTAKTRVYSRRLGVDGQGRDVQGASSVDGLFFAAARETPSRPLTPVFSADVPEHLVSSGPYRLVRHPFYTAYLLTYIAGWTVTGVPALLVVFDAMATLYAVAARREEQKFRHSPLAQNYICYAERTGMLWPSVRWRTRGDR